MPFAPFRSGSDARGPNRNPTMNTLITLGLLLAAGPLAPLEAQEPASSIHWYADYDAGMEAARKSGKPVVLEFAGSDW